MESAIFFDIGLDAKAKPDLMTDRVIVDIKTSQSADPDDFHRSISKYGYHWQEYWYTEAAFQLGKNLDFYFFVIESQPPFDYSIVKLDQEYFDLAECQIEDAIQGIKCQRFESRWKDAIHRVKPAKWETKPRREARSNHGKTKVCSWCQQKYSSKDETVCEQCCVSLCSPDCLEIHTC